MDSRGGPGGLGRPGIPAGLVGRPSGHTCRSFSKQSGPAGHGEGSAGGPAAAMVRARLLGFGFRARTSGREFRSWSPGGRHGSLSSPRFRFPGANLGPGVSRLEARRPTRFALDSPFSVSGREPRAGSFKVGGPAAGTVRARLPASPLFSVFGREPRAEDFGVGGPAAAMVRARLPAFGFRARTSGRGFRGWRPGGRHGSRSSSRFRFSGANLGPGISGLKARWPPRFALVSPISVFGREPRAGNFGAGGPSFFPGRGLLPAPR